MRNRGSVLKVAAKRPAGASEVAKKPASARVALAQQHLPHPLVPVSEAQASLAAQLPARTSVVAGTAVGSLLSQRTHIFFVDELVQPASEQVGHCEVYLRNVPIRDYTLENLKSWLSEFGVIDSFYLCENAHGYVRFAEHSQAKAVIDACRVIGEVQATWSMSELMSRGTGPYFNASHRFMASLAVLKTDLHCSLLILAGGPWFAPGGALHIIAKSAWHKQDLIQSLAQALSEVTDI
jgi:hypothetical protein